MATSRRRDGAREDRLDRVFGALSDRTRRAMLLALGRGDLGITELAAPFDMTLPAASKHVRVLERAGLVRRSVEGRVHRCALEPAPMVEAIEWLAQRRQLWEETLDALEQHVRASRSERR